MKTCTDTFHKCTEGFCRKTNGAITMREHDTAADKSYLHMRSSVALTVIVFMMQHSPALLQ